MACLHKDAAWKHHSEPAEGPSEVPKFRWPVAPLSPQFQSESDDLFISAGADMPFEHCHRDRRFSGLFLRSSKHQWEWGCEGWADERGPSKGCKAEGDAGVSLPRLQQRFVWRTPVETRAKHGSARSYLNFYVWKYVFQMFFPARNCQDDKETAV